MFSKVISTGPSGAHRELLEVEQHLVGDGSERDDRGAEVHDLFAEIAAALAAAAIDLPVGEAQAQVVDAPVARRGQFAGRRVAEGGQDRTGERVLTAGRGPGVGGLGGQLAEAFERRQPDRGIGDEIGESPETAAGVPGDAGERPDRRVEHAPVAPLAVVEQG